MGGIPHSSGEIRPRGRLRQERYKYEAVPSCLYNPSVPIPIAQIITPVVTLAAATTMLVYDIPKTHRAAVYDKPGTISTKIVEVETPEPGPGDVLVRL